MTLHPYQVESRRIDRQTDWLKVFPEAESVVRSLLSQRLKEREKLKQAYKSELTPYFARGVNPHLKTAAEIVLGSYYATQLDENERHVRRLHSDLTKRQPQSQESTRLTEQQIESARQYPLADLFEAEGFTLRRQGATFLTHCPLHDEHTPSCTIYPDGHFFCYGCQRGGDTLDFVQKVKNLSFREAVTYLTN